MIVVQASFQIVERDEVRGCVKNIEDAGRTCYKSTSKGNPEKFVHGLIERQHEAMLEHGDYIFMVDDDEVWHETMRGLRTLRDKTGRKPMIDITNINGRRIISGNIRAWREFLSLTSAGCYYSGHIDPLYTYDIAEAQGDLFENAKDIRVHRIFYKDLRDRFEKLTHHRQTVRFIVDRGVSHEIVRHRTFSFAQESTRYCNYSKEKFGNQITVINPSAIFDDKAVQFGIWWDACHYCEECYFKLLASGATPQEARSVLPNSLKTEIVVTGNLRAWKHFFFLRAKQVTGAAHPQIVEVAKPLYEVDKVLFPEVFEEM